MALKSVFSPELKNKLAEKQRYLVSSQKAISQFARFPGPDDEYYFRLAKVTAGVDRKTQGFKFNFKFVCVANKRSRDAEFAGAPMNVTFRCYVTKNSTEEENWNRFYTDGLQALGFQTSKWPADQAMALLDEALGQLNETKPPVVLRIRSDGNFQNANIVEVLKSDALDEFAQPSLEVDDSMPDDADEEGQSAVDIQLAQLVVTLKNMDRAKLLDAMKQQNVSMEGITAMTPDDKVREVIYAHFELQLRGQPSPEAAAPAVQPTSAAPTGSAPVEEVLEESLDEPVPAYDALVMTTLAKLERKPVQLYTRKLVPDMKFFPTDTDAFLRERLWGLLLTDDHKKAFLTEMSVPF